MKEYTPEELEQMLEKAKRDWQEQLDKMTPEERAQAESRAQAALEADQAAMQKLLADVAALTGGAAPKTQPKFCGHCGAPAGSGTLCEYCGLPL